MQLNRGLVRLNGVLMRVAVSLLAGTGGCLWLVGIGETEHTPLSISAEESPPLKVVAELFFSGASLSGFGRSLPFACRLILAALAWPFTPTHVTSDMIVSCLYSPFRRKRRFCSPASCSIHSLSSPCDIDSIVRRRKLPGRRSPETGSPSKLPQPPRLSGLQTCIQCTVSPLFSPASCTIHSLPSLFDISDPNLEIYPKSNPYLKLPSSLQLRNSKWLYAVPTCSRFGPAEAGRW